jgi:hypothetical protein
VRKVAELLLESGQPLEDRGRRINIDRGSEALRKFRQSNSLAVQSERSIAMPSLAMLAKNETRRSLAVR